MSNVIYQQFIAMYYSGCQICCNWSGLISHIYTWTNTYICTIDNIGRYRYKIKWLTIKLFMLKASEA